MWGSAPLSPAVSCSAPLSPAVSCSAPLSPVRYHHYPRRAACANAIHAPPPPPFQILSSTVEEEPEAGSVVGRIIGSISRIFRGEGAQGREGEEEGRKEEVHRLEVYQPCDQRRGRQGGRGRRSRTGGRRLAAIGPRGEYIRITRCLPFQTLRLSPLIICIPLPSFSLCSQPAPLVGV